MLSPDVPEFIPRSYQTPASTNIDNLNPKERTSYAAHIKPSPKTHIQSHTKPDPALLPKNSSWRGERDRTNGLQRQKHSWPQPREAFSIPRVSPVHEPTRHENGTEALQEINPSTPKKKFPENEISLKGKGKRRTVVENLEFHIKNKFVTAPNPPRSYTRILKSKHPTNSTYEEQASKKEDFSFSTEGQWPTLGESLPLSKVPEKTIEPRAAGKNNSNPWVTRSNEGSPMKNPWLDRGSAEQTTDFSVRPKTTHLKSPVKSVVNPWQEKDTEQSSSVTHVKPREISSSVQKLTKQTELSWRKSTREQNLNAAVRPKISEGNSKTSENSMRIKSSSHTSQIGGNSKLESGCMHPPDDPSDKYDKEPRSQNAYVRAALSTKVTHTLVMQNQEGAAQANTNAHTQDSSLYRWKVMGEKKKKLKIKRPQEEVRVSPRLQSFLRGDSNQHVRAALNRPSRRDDVKLNRDCTRNTKKYVLDLSKNKDVPSPSMPETHDAVEKDTSASKTGQREKRKPRPAIAMDTSSYSNSKKDTKLHSNTAASTPAARPVDEESLQKKLAAKLIKREERRKLKEMKANEALRGPKDTRVSFISPSFLEKTQMLDHHAKRTTAAGEKMSFTFEEYPTLQRQHNTTPNTHQNKKLLPTRSPHKVPPSRSLPSDIDDPKASSCLSSHINTATNSTSKPSLRTSKITHSSKRLPADDLLSGLLSLNYSSDGEGDIVGEFTNTYRTALLAAKEKEVTPDKTSFTLKSDSHETTPQKKKVRTRDPIELDLFALATQSGRNRKKDSPDYAQKFSPGKRRLLFEEKREEDINARKGAAVVAKREKINLKKTKKKKVSRVKKCKIEKLQKEMVALRLLLQEARIRQQQEDITGAAATEPTQAEATSGGQSKSLPDPLHSHTPTHPYQEGKEETPHADNKKENQGDAKEESEEKTKDDDENKENEVADPSQQPGNVNLQIDKTSAQDVHCRKVVCKVRGIQSIPESETPLPANTNDSNTKGENEEKVSSQDSTKEGNEFSFSPTHQKLLTDDPLISQTASDLVEFFKSERETGPKEHRYCHQVVTPEVNDVAKKLITSLIAFQRRHHQRDPTKARIRKRYVCGLKETTKLMGKISCVIMAPNIEQCAGPGSLDDVVEKLLNQAEKFKVPVVFALSTKVMNMCHRSSRKVSCFGIISYQGAQDLFHRMMELLPEAQRQYQQLVAIGQCTLPKEEEEEEAGEEGSKKPANDLNTEVLAHTKSLLMAP